MTQSDCPEVTLCSRQDVKIQFLTNCLCVQANRLDLCCCVKPGSKDKPDKQEGLLYTFVKDFYSHFIMKEWVRPIVVSASYLILCMSITSSSLGLRLVLNTSLLAD